MQMYSFFFGPPGVRAAVPWMFLGLRRPAGNFARALVVPELECAADYKRWASLGAGRRGISLVCLMPHTPGRYIIFLQGFHIEERGPLDRSRFYFGLVRSHLVLFGPAGVDGQNRGVCGFSKDVPLDHLGFVFCAWWGGPPDLPTERPCEGQHHGGASQGLPGRGTFAVSPAGVL